MLFNSPEFLFLFLPLTALGFFLLGDRRPSMAAAWLAIASLFFYGWWNPVYIGLLLASIGTNYAVGLSLARHAGEGLTGKRKRVLAGGVAFNLLLLGYYKYANFFVDNLNAGLVTNLELAPIVLPLGISFFTFTQIAFLVDAYRGEAHEYRFIHYTLFVTYFPHLIAGPILHHKEMMPQFGDRRIYRLDLENVAVGVTIFSIGLFKKVMIADNLAVIATPTFAAAEAGESLHFFQAATGIVAYTLQLYFDFSGYSDMAIGASRLFGVKLPLNFDSPYQATGIIDFWRRWHMTLSRFLRDYLYIPLGGNRHGEPRRYLNLMVTMLLGGFWHGAGWTFILWGALHGLYLVVNTAWQRAWVRPINRWWSRAIARLVTLGAVMLGWVFFRAETVDGALNMLAGLTNLPHTFVGRIGWFEPMLVGLGFRFEGPWLTAGNVAMVGWFVFWLGFLWVLPNTQQLMSRFEPALQASSPKGEVVSGLQKIVPRLFWAPTTRWGVAIGVVLAVSVLSLSRVSEFLYFQF